MRTIAATFFMSLDGVVETPEAWHFPYFNEEMGAALMADMARADILLFGRTTYDIQAAAWPAREAAGEKAGDEAGFAKLLGDARKVVVSRQRLDLTWRNSEQLQGDLIEAVTALKEEPGGEIALNGSVSIVRQLLDAGLLDELRLFVDPIAVRHGMRLFGEAGTTMPLQLRSSEVYANGVLHLTYGRA